MVRLKLIRIQVYWLWLFCSYKDAGYWVALRAQCMLNVCMAVIIGWVKEKKIVDF